MFCYSKYQFFKLDTHVQICIFRVILLILFLGEWGCSDPQVNMTSDSSTPIEDTTDAMVLVDPSMMNDFEVMATDQNELDHGIERDAFVPPIQNFKAAPSTLHRLSRAQIRQSITDLFHVQFESPLEVDSILHGFVSVAASELTISPLFAEQIEQVAWEVSQLVIDNLALVSQYIHCASADLSALDLEQPESYPQAQTQLRNALREDSCLRVSLAHMMRKVWRGHYDEVELQSMIQIVNIVSAQLQDPIQGFKAAIAYMIQSPYFLFRIERGEFESSEVHEDLLNQRRYSSVEMAARLSYFLWGTTPDEALLAQAETGNLIEDQILRSEALRLLQDERAKMHLSQFFEEFIGLQNLALVIKDEALFPEMTAELKQAMRTEIVWLFQKVVFEEQSDFRQILTSEDTYINGDLAQIYNINYRQQTWQQFTLPFEQNRGGLLGRAGVLSLFSHATVNSPTFRGRFIRSQLLCQDVPPPPEGVVTELPEGDESETQTLRERLSMHVQDPICASCHTLMDPLGFPLEHFNPIGRWRNLDGNLPIDASGNLDGMPVDGARSLAQAIAQHPAFPNCVARRLYRYATGQLERFGEEPVLQKLNQYFIQDANYNLQDLIIALVLSDGFRKASVPRGVLCNDVGATRACETLCGTGIETCNAGHWGGCTAKYPQTELCDGEDQDCDGIIDEAVIQTCVHACGGFGIQTCTQGSWQTCIPGEVLAEICDGEDQDCDGIIDEAIMSVEICDGEDQDCDGIIDEEVQHSSEICDGEDQDCDGMIDEDVQSYRADGDIQQLSSFHEGCSTWGDTRRDNCNSAVHRQCNQSGCSATGFGPIAIQDDQRSWFCLAADQVHRQGVDYQELSQKHPNCDQTNEVIGANCNAAIHRYCRDNGYTTGFGPVEYQGSTAYITCVPSAQVISSTYTVLSQFHAECTQSTRIGPSCDQAIHQFCVSQGALSGWGPIENSGDIAMLSCFFAP
jgi:hypothetical protein